MRVFVLAPLAASAAPVEDVPDFGTQSVALRQPVSALVTRLWPGPGASTVVSSSSERLPW
jgi:hypothetical protein